MDGGRSRGRFRPVAAGVALGLVGMPAALTWSVAAGAPRVLTAGPVVGLPSAVASSPGTGAPAQPVGSPGAGTGRSAPPSAPLSGPATTVQVSGAGGTASGTSWRSDLVSAALSGEQPAGYVDPQPGSRVPALSQDGRFVAFSSAAPDLVPDDTNGVADVFVRDRLRGVTVRVSVADDGSQADGASFAPAISAGGRYVVFVSRATDLAPGDTDPHPSVLLRDLWTGMTRLVSTGVPAPWDRGAMVSPSLSARGRFVAFVSLRGTPGGPAATVWVRDRVTGTTRSALPSPPARSHDVEPVISEHGRFIALTTDRGLVPDDTDGLPDVYLVDRDRGVVRRVPVGTADARLHRRVGLPAMSSHARRVVVVATADDGRGGTTRNVFVWDRATGTTRLVSATGAGERLASVVPPESTRPAAISADGREVAFVSTAPLLREDTDATADVYVRDLATGRLELVTREGPGGVDGASLGAVLDARGQEIGLVTAAPDGRTDVLVAQRG